ncbi:unnamed protein product [Haemonchus placei]|uniref:Alpha/beta hydrolase n=1 Tax=Haemonchus placei TaxID=6290 RepID=A0A0N4X268_HAEPC|nr:unnamed protein product [Haemonchus placei]
MTAGSNGTSVAIQTSAAPVATPQQLSAYAGSSFLVRFSP